MEIKTKDKEYLKFAWFRIIAGIIIAIGVLWGITFLVNHFTPRGNVITQRVAGVEKTRETGPSHKITHQEAVAKTSPKGLRSSKSHEIRAAQPSPRGAAHAKPAGPAGVAFVDALIAPIRYELTERFWGWRPNDILNFTDNVNNFQRGVLEVTRRATIALNDKISRTGAADSLNVHLERAMNWFMIKADHYWLPSPESKYREAIDELNIYKEQLKKGRAKFYTRTDNLIPLLSAFQELLGSCDNNLVKAKEDNGEPVSTFRADDYLYYARGVASAMETILEAVGKDFPKILDTRNGNEILHHAIESCHAAAQIDPWLFVTEADLSGIFANHRANMASQISHARFYVQLLIETLST